MRPSRGDDRTRSEVSLRRKAAVLLSIIGFVALAVGSLFGDGGMLHLLEERERAEQLQREILRLEEENSRLAAEIRSLRGDPRAIERIAREELGLARPDETVFLIRDEAAPDHP